MSTTTGTIARREPIENRIANSEAVLVALHFLPGAAIFLAYVIAAPFALQLGYPPTQALNLALLLVGIPLQLGFLFYLGRRRNGKLSLKGVVVWRQTRPLWPFLLIIPYTAYAAFIWGAGQPLADLLTGTIFAGLPSWFLEPSALLGIDPTQTAIAVFLLSNLLINGIASPIVEEFYFRGFLLPRLTAFGIWAPAVNALLFSLAHLWQPQYAVSLFLLVVPLYYLVWWRRNVYLAVIGHALGNTIGAVLLFGELLG